MAKAKTKTEEAAILARAASGTTRTLGKIEVEIYRGEPVIDEATEASVRKTYGGKLVSGEHLVIRHGNDDLVLE